MSVIHKLFNVSGEICIFEDKSARRMGYVGYVNDFARNFAKCSPILQILSPAE